jgi:type II restriction enzyme
MSGAPAAAYTSGSQRARVVTEAWGEENLYCPNCPSPKLDRLPHNTRVLDFKCPACSFIYQLKGQKTRLGDSINDGAYKSMMEAVENDRTPNFYFMQYDLATWRIKNLLLIPHFAFPASAIIKRKPLAPTARRAGWVGCNIALNLIPLDARIALVDASRMISESEVREKFRRVKPLKELSVTERGWTLDVLAAVRSLKKVEFTNQDLYALERHFEKLHPGNRHVRDKIRQQLQVLRDAGLVRHDGRGRWGQMINDK